MPLTEEDMNEIARIVGNVGQPTTLRAKIQAAIERSHGPEAAGLAVCRVLEKEIGLAGNGWFDDDQEALKAIGMDE